MQQSLIRFVPTYALTCKQLFKAVAGQNNFNYVTNFGQFNL